MNATVHLMKKTILRSENPDPVDIYVGTRMRARRNLVGLSQEQLGKALGLTFQQVQKYERGTNRMGASRLHQISKILMVPVSYFFDGFEEGPMSNLVALNSADPSQLTGPAGHVKEDILHRRETLELVRAYYKIQDPKQRRKVFELIKSMSDET